MNAFPLLRAAAVAILGGLAACSASVSPAPPPTSPPTPTEEAPTMREDPVPESAQVETATFGAGCFWCVEAVLEQVDGVIDARSGYMGGTVADPTYEQVCSGRTGHAEVVQVDFDPAKVSYEALLHWFFKLHDPTTLNRQGPDAGTQYRSAIFFHSPAQKEIAERVKRDVGPDFADPVVTQIAEAGAFYEAEDYHQDYYRQNSGQPYCRAMIAPKLGKLGLER